MVIIALRVEACCSDRLVVLHLDCRNDFAEIAHRCVDRSKNYGADVGALDHWSTAALPVPRTEPRMLEMGLLPPGLQDRTDGSLSPAPSIHHCAEDFVVRLAAHSQPAGLLMPPSPNRYGLSACASPRQA